MRHVAS
jgi:hypothetical protein